MENCKIPFIIGDFTSFDKVADGRLYLSEVDDDQLTCIVDHLIYTKDQEVHDEFRLMVQNDLWEAIRKRLAAVKKDDDLPKDVKERIAHLLSTDYSNKKFTYLGGAEYQYGAFTLSTSQTGQHYLYELQQHGITVFSKVDGNFDIGTWKLAPSLLISGDQYWTFEDEELSGVDISEGGSSDYRGLWGRVSFGALRRDEAIRLSAYLFGALFQAPPPGFFKTFLDIGGEFYLQEIGKTPLSANSSVTYKKYDYVPVGQDLMDPELESLTIDSEVSYMFEKAGLLLSYSHEYIDSVEPMLARETSSDSGSLLAHIAFNGGFIRLGAGGGYWNEHSKLIDGEPNHSNGAEAHGDVMITWSPVAQLDLILSSSIYANNSKGTFVGWFPSAEGALDVNLALGNALFNLGGKVEGSYRDLNLHQEMIEYSLHTNASYSPADDFNASVGLEYSGLDQDGYEKYKESSWSGSSSINYRIMREKPDLWLKFNAKIEKTEHKESMNRMDMLMASFVTTLYLKY